MIALRDNLPLIVLSASRTVAFEEEWLRRALGVAANRAGYPKWWLAEHVARSVKVWLETVAESSPSVTVAQLTRAVHGALQVIGYADVGRHFEAAAPFARISLIEVAREAGEGFELAFFSALTDRLRDVLGLGGSYCEMHGLDHCVKHLRRRRGWSRQSTELREEIVEFARQTTNTLRQTELFLYVS